jgi:hypothetical protein
MNHESKRIVNNSLTREEKEEEAEDAVMGVRKVEQKAISGSLMAMIQITNVPLTGS